MVRPGSRICFAFLLASGPVFAAEAWENKLPAQWTRKDVDKILRDSPWSKVISTPTTWARTGGEKWGVSPPTKISIGGGDKGVVNSGRSDDPYDPQNHEGYFILRWASAKTIRSAKLRNLQLRGAKPAAQDAAGEHEDLYQLELVWDLFARFPQASEMEAAQNSYLKPSRMGVEFQPVRVEYRRGTAGAVTSVVFFFRRKTAGGKALIAEDEFRVDFFWRVGPSSIGARFDPRKMVALEEKDF